MEINLFADFSNIFHLAAYDVLQSHLLHQTLYLHPSTKLWEGNVISCVCESVQGWVDTGTTTPHPFSTWTSLYSPPDMFQLVHYEARTIGNPAVGIRLKWPLV